MINQKINPVMGYDDIEVLYGTTNGSQVSFTPRSLRTNDMVIGFWLRVNPVAFNNENAVRLTIDGVESNDVSVRANDFFDGCAGVAVKKLTAPATTASVTAIDVASGTKHAVLVVIPNNIYSSQALDNGRIDAAANEFSAGLTNTVDVTANLPVVYAGAQIGSSSLSVTNIGTQVTLRDFANASARIIVGLTTSPTSDNDGVNIAMSGASNTQKAFAVAALK